MISGRIQPAMEETAQEILQTVENMNVNIEASSGVVIGADGKKYKPLMNKAFVPTEIDTTKLPINISSNDKLWEVNDYLVIMNSGGSKIDLYDKFTLNLVCSIQPSSQMSNYSIANSTFFSNIKCPIMITDTHIMLVVAGSQSSYSQRLLIYSIDGSFVKNINLSSSQSGGFTFRLYNLNDGYIYISGVGQHTFISRVPVSVLLDTVTTTLALNNAPYLFIDFYTADTGVALFSDMYVEGNILYAVTHASSSTIHTMGIRKYDMTTTQLISKVNIVTSNRTGVFNANLKNYTSDKLIAFCGEMFIVLIDKETLSTEIFTPEKNSTFDMPHILPFEDETTKLLHAPTAFNTLNGITIFEYKLLNGKIKTSNRWVSPFLYPDSAGQIRVISIAGELFAYSAQYWELTKLKESTTIIGYEEVIDHVVITE